MKWWDKSWNPVVECYEKPFSTIQLLEERLDIPLRRKIPTTWFVNSMSDLFHPDVPFEFIDKVFAVMALCSQHTFLVLTKQADRMKEYFKCEGSRTHPDRCMEIGCIAGDMEHEHNIKCSIIEHLPFPNVWLGVTVCNQEEADKNIPLLLQTPAARRFLSIEPMLGPIDLIRAYGESYYCSKCGYCGDMDRRCCVECSNEVDGLQYNETDAGDCSKCGQGTMTAACPKCDTYIGQDDGEAFAMLDCYHEKPLPGIAQVNLGGETGKDARPIHPDWARKVRDDCEAAGVPFMFKQWGEWLQVRYESETYKRLRCGSKNMEYADYHHYENKFYIHCACAIAERPCFYRVGKKRAGRLLDGVEHNDLAWSYND